MDPSLFLVYFTFLKNAELQEVVQSALTIAAAWSHFTERPILGPSGYAKERERVCIIISFVGEFNLTIREVRRDLLTVFVRLWLARSGWRSVFDGELGAVSVVSGFQGLRVRHALPYLGR